MTSIAATATAVAAGVKSRSQYLGTFFPNDAKGITLNVNYTEETLAYMTPFGKADRLAKTVTDLFEASYVVDASAGIGGNVMGFARNAKITKVLCYEALRDRWTMLHNNLATYNQQRKVTAYNQEFDIGEDLALLNIDDPAIESKTVVYFDPPWLPPGMSIDKSNYILTGMRISGRTLEDWCRYLCHAHKFRGVIMHVPRGYTLALPGQIIDDNSDNKSRLIYYTLDTNAITRITKETGTKLSGEANIVITVGDGQLSFQKPLEDIPPPLPSTGPKVILQTYLTPDFPRRRYFKEIFNPKAIHLGQRRLLLAEIEFLTRVLKNRTGNGKDDQYTVLYIGAAPGHHIPLLSEMFAEVKFVLYDPAPFQIEPSKSIKIHRELFTSETLMKRYGTEELRKQNGVTGKLLLISDIRSLPRAQQKDDNRPDPEFEDEVRKNLDQQKEWVLALNPYRSLLKFRLPFTAEEEQATTEYFDGILHFPAYAPPQSAETNLEVGPRPKMIEYDHTCYEQQLFYFNTQYRVQRFQAYSRKYGWSYDTIREYFIIKKYLALRGMGDNNIPKYFEKFDQLTSDPEKKITTILAKQTDHILVLPAEPPKKAAPVVIPVGKITNVDVSELLQIVGLK